MLNGEDFMFKIPTDPGLQPYSWCHLCWKSDCELHEIIFNGQQWYHGKHKLKSSKKATLNQFLMGFFIHNKRCMRLQKISEEN